MKGQILAEAWRKTTETCPALGMTPEWFAAVEEAYEDARAKLPEDVNTFVREVEVYAPQLPFAFGDDARRLCVIVRANGSLIASLRAHRDALGQRCNEIEEERDELRERIDAIQNIDNTNLDTQAEKLADVFAGKNVDGCNATESEIIAVRKTLAYCATREKELRERLAKLEKELAELESQKRPVWWCPHCHIMNLQNEPRCTSCGVDCPELPALRARLGKLEAESTSLYGKLADETSLREAYGVERDSLRDHLAKLESENAALKQAIQTRRE